DQDADKNGSQFVYNLRFPGQYWDNGIKLSHNWYRTYNSETGRYIQSDPIGLMGGLNTFGYVGGKPTALTDPTGESPVAAAYRGYRIGNFIGERINPYVQPYIAEALDSMFPHTPVLPTVDSDPYSGPMEMSKGGKSQGRNWATESAKVEAKQKGIDPCDILADWLKEAKAAGNKKEVQDLIEAQKFLDCRNKDKRKSKYRCE
ncbi:RHS repeat-associated core domain-containing protein, partial [Chitinivorax sp. B]|uniref:RHS repeat-associated core domain-containing protein n=1 Tax=Chitinivorax sp. B TaxID=2502235 RepID=UPI0010F5718F